MPRERIKEIRKIVRTKRRALFPFFLGIIFILVPILYLTILKSPFVEAAWFDENWAYRKLITIDKDIVSGSADLSNFPALITFTSDSDLSDGAQEDGDDIFFIDSSGNRLSHEIERYTSGTLVAWVKIPTLSYSVDTQIYMYYGNPRATNQENPDDVWSNSFQGVWHMAEDPSISTDGDCGGGTKELCDSTANGNHADSNGTMTTGDLITGQVGYAMDMDGANDYFSIADSPSFDIGTGNATWQFWFYSRNSGGIMGHTNGSSATDGWWLSTAWYDMWLSMDDTDHNLGYGNEDAWHHVNAVKNGTTITWYVDGVAQNSEDNSKNVNNSNANFTIGAALNAYLSEYFDGILDEVRFVNTNRSADWITTEYRNQNAPATYLSLGTQEQVIAPVAFLKFDEGVSNTCLDGTSDACDSTVNINSAAFGSTTAAPTWQKEDMCVNGKCIWFDGTDDVATITASESLSLDDQLTSGFTVQGWYKPNSLGESSNGQLFYKGSATYLRLAAGSNSGVADIQASLSLSGNSATVTIDDAITLNTWHHISMSYTDDGDDEISIYIDGILRGTSTNGSGTPFEDGGTPETYPTIQATNTSATTSTSATTHTVSLPSGISSGDLLVIFFRTGATSTTHTLSGWNTLATRDSTGRTTIFWKIATGAEGGSVNVTSGAGRASAHTSYRITGYDSTDPIDGVFASTNTLDPASLDPGWGSSKILWLAMANTRRTDNSLTAPTNYGTLIGNQSNASSTSTNHTRVATAIREYEAASENPGAFGSTGNLSAQHSALVAIKPTPAAGGGGNDLLLGGNTSAHYHGFIDNFKVYNYERTSDQIMTDAIKNASTNGSSAVFGETNSTLSDGLVGYWPMDESSGTRYDFSGNNNSLTDNNTVTPTVGKFGNASDFESNSSEYLSITDANQNGLDLTQTLTINVWLNFESTDNQRGIVSKGEYNSMGYVLQSSWGELNLIIDEDGNGSGNGNIDIVTSGSYLSTGALDMHTITYDGEFIRLYRNGVEQVSGDFPYSTNINLYNTGDSFFLGYRSDVAGYYDGTMDEVRIYSRALTAREVKNLYHWAPGPVAYYSFDENTGISTVYDKSGNGNNGAINGSITESDWVSGAYGSALDFNGTNDYVGSTDFLYSDAFTVCAWFNQRSQHTNGRGIVTKWNSSGTTTGDPEWTMVIHDDIPTFYSYQNNSTSTGIDFGGNTSISTNTWYHMCVVQKGIGNDAIMYINGQDDGISIGTVAQTAVMQNTSSVIQIGGRRNNDNNTYFDGMVDDVRIYNYARTPSQIIEDMNGGHPIGGSPIGSQATYLRFDDMGGDYAYDSSPNGLNAWLAGGTTCPGDTTCPTWTTGKIDGGLEFDGNDFIETPASSTYDNNGTNPISHTLWFKSSTKPSSENYLLAGVVESSNNEQQDKALQIDSSGQARFYTWNGSSEVYAQGTSDVTDGQWHHLAGIFDGTTNYIYVDGVLQDSTPSTVTENFTNPQLRFSIEYWFGYYENTIGTIDEYKYYNAALTADQVLIDMNANAAINFGTGYDEADQLADGAGNPPMAYWSMDENKGTTAYSRGISTDDMQSVMTSGTMDWVPGKLGSALDFELGDTEYLNIPSWESVTDVTVMAWIKMESVNGSDQMTIIQHGPDWDMAIDTDGTLYFEDYDQSRNSTEVLSIGQWYHVAVVYDLGNSIRMYINGRLDSTYASASGNDGDASLTIGARASGVDQYFDGLIDEVKVYNYLRTPAQIAYDYNRGEPIGWWKFDECQGSTANDASGNGNNGTIYITGTGTNQSLGTCSSGVSTEAWNNGTSGKFNSSIYLDGGDEYITVGDIAQHSFTAGSTVDTPFSISYWVKNGANAYHINKGLTGGTSEYNVYSGGGTNNRRINFQLSASTGTYIRKTTVNEYPNTTWTLITLTYNGSEDVSGLNIYFDGILQETTTATGGTYEGMSNTTNPLVFGARLDSGSGVYNDTNGYLDDIRLYNYELSAKQIKIIVNNGTAYFGPSEGTP